MNRPTAALLVLAAMHAVAVAQDPTGQPSQPPAAGPTRIWMPEAGAPPQGPTTLSQAWTTALSTMRAHKAPGLVFVLPPEGRAADPKAVEEALGHFRSKAMAVPVEVKTTRDLALVHIQLLRQQPWVNVPRAGSGGGDAAGDTVAVPLAGAFALAVPVVAEASRCGAKDGETLLLLGDDGRRLAGFAVDLADPVAVAQKLQPHLFAESVLAARRANVPPDLQRELDAVRELQRRAVEKPEAEPDASLPPRLAKLKQNVHAVAPALLPTDAAPAEGRRAPAAMLEIFAEQVTPLGTEVAVTWDPCPPCGMMAMPLPFRSALKLLAQ